MRWLTKQKEVQVRGDHDCFYFVSLKRQQNLLQEQLNQTKAVPSADKQGAAIDPERPN